VVRLGVLVFVLAGVVVGGAQVAGAKELVVTHGIGFTKGCTSPVSVGGPYSCSYTVQNVNDDAGDTLTISGLNDTVHSAGGDVSSGNIFSSIPMTTTTTSGGSVQSNSTCFARVRSGSDLIVTQGSTTVTSSTAVFTAADNGRKILIAGQPYMIASGSGSTATLTVAYAGLSGTNVSWIIAFKNPAQDGSIGGLGPYTNVAYCELPDGSRVNLLSTSQYTVQAADFNLSNHQLTDSALLHWNDECDGPLNTVPSNCNPSPSPDAGAASQATVNAPTTPVTTSIHDASHTVVTAVQAGATVHDLVTVSGGASPPTGNVSVDWFTNDTCAGAPAASSGPVGPLVAGAGSTSSFDATGFAQGPLAAGMHSFKGHYAGDSSHGTGDGACEPLAVVDANVSITPNGTNRIGQAHTFTAHVNVNNGTGFAPAPDGTSISFTNDNGPGTFTTPNPCTTTGGTGSCTVTLTSGTTGVTTVSAHVTVGVGGLSVHRDTNGVGGNSGPATKTWVNAKIAIAQSATNGVGQPHTFTVTLSKDTGTGSFVPAAGEHVDVTLTDSAGAAHTAPTGSCTSSGANTDANGQCTITFTSPTAGKVTAHATSTLSVAGSAPFTVATDGTGLNSSDTLKTFVDANIQISPLTATNAVGTPHTFTAHVNVNDSTGFVPAPAGTSIAFSITSGPGSFVGGVNTCVTVGATGECSVQITSATAGVTTLKASTTLSVGGVTLTRATGDTNAGDSASAQKTWVDANIQITPATATNPLNTTHVLTGHVNVNSGTGFVNAPDGTAIAFALVSGPGGFVGASACTTSGGTGSCTAAITSSVAGTTVISASTTVTVGGLSLTRSTGDSLPGDGANAQKSWQNLGPCVLGYPDSSHLPRSSAAFNESTVLVSAAVFGTGANQRVGVFTTDEHALTLGVNPNPGGQPVTPYPGSVVNQGTAPISVGNAAVTDGSGRPLFPSMFATDITTNANSRAGDWQQLSDNSTAIGPTRMFGTWKAATQSGTSITPDADPAQNQWNLGTGADPAPTSVQTEGYTSEVVYSTSSLGLIPGHAYRLQVIVHDGDQNHTGGDVGESCVNVVIPPGPPAPDANITVTPPSASNIVNSTHVLTGTVKVNSGAGLVAAPDGTSIGFSIVSGPGSFVGASSCVTSGGTGSCTATITSSVAGTTVVRAATNVTVLGQLLHRETNDANVGDGLDASKLWQNPPPCVLGYPDASNNPRSSVAFNESTVLVSAAVYGSGANQHVGVFATDEHALTLGVDPDPDGTPTTPYPGSVVNGGTSPVDVGNVAAADPSGRPIFPSMFVTDITSSVNSRAGDWQQAGNNSGAVGPTRLFGAWKTATQSGTSITPGPDPAQNQWNLGAGADPVPSGVNSLGYGTEVVWNTNSLGLIPGHTYRLEVMVHDGDQNQSGGDVGEACVNVSLPAAPPPPDANISIAPASSNGVVGTNQTFAGHVNVNGGGGYVSAADGTTISYSIVSGPGSIVGSSSCATSGGTGSCSVTVASATVGTTVLRATTSVVVGGSTLGRATGDANIGDGPDAQVGWGPPPPKAALVAQVSGKDANTVASQSFTLKANTTYLVFAFTQSNTGDSATVGSTFAGSPVFHAVGAGSQFFLDHNYDFAWWVNGGASDATGTITVTFALKSNQAYLEVVQLNGNKVSSPIAQSVYAQGNNTSPYTANLAAAPAAGDNEVDFLTTQDDLGGTAPVATPAMTNLGYDHAGSGSQATYASDTASQNSSFAGGNKKWGAVAVEINHA
jgi:hypothetical protein